MDTEQLWYKDAIIYELHVRSFYDSDGDGIGDFRGLARKLDYLQELGVTALWLLPFFPSPLRDDGYDIADYTNVHPSCGTLADFRHFLREAHRRGLRVIIELVLNHTSDQHPWFQRARRAPPGDERRNFYVWSETPDRYAEARVIFRDFESSNWTWDPVARAYYWHRFYSHQPDLNYDNPAVQKAILGVLDFWLQLGVDGFRLDAVPYLYEREGTNCENLPETHAFLKKLRRHIDQRFPGRMLLAEANQWPEDAVAYFGQGDEAHMVFHFPLMPRLFLALRMEDRQPLVDILRQTPPIPLICQWALFLRNHDELTLEMVTDEERDFMYRTYARDPQARINLGIRRRLAPLLGNDRRAIELMVGLLFSLPGTPVLYYGDEIGMGDNIYLGDRNGVRTPMQWTAGRNAGFSEANPQRLVLPVIIDPVFHYESVNVEAQRNNPHSLLSWMKRIIAVRRSCPAFGWGALEFIEPDNRCIVAFTRSWQEQTLLVVANLSAHAQYAELDLRRYRGLQPVELFGQTRFPPIGELPYLLTLGPHAFYWFALEPRPVEIVTARQPVRTVAARVEVVGDWERVLRRENWPQWEPLLTARLGEAAEPSRASRRLQRCVVEDALTINGAGALLLVRAEFSEEQRELRLLPLAYVSEGASDESSAARPAVVFARVQGPGGSGVLRLGMTPALAQRLLECLLRRRRLKGQAGEALFVAAQSLRAWIAALPTLVPSEESSDPMHMIIRYGERLALKLYARPEPGSHPALEIPAFLLKRTHFRNFLPPIGELQYRRGRQETITLAVCQEMAPQWTDGWTLAQQALDAFRHRAAALPFDTQEVAELGIPELGKPVPEGVREVLGEFGGLLALLGVRTAEMHIALGTCVDEAGFVPEPFSPNYQRSLYQSMRNLLRQATQALAQQWPGWEVADREAGQRLAAMEARLLETLRLLLERRIPAMRTRIHGDYRLERILYTGKDFLVMDFEGEPWRPLSERSIKRSPLRDVASLLWSLRCVADAEAAAGVPAVEGDDGGVRWWQMSAGVFLEAYVQTVAGVPFLPPSLADTQFLLRLYLLEKVFGDLLAKLERQPEQAPATVRQVLQLVRPRHREAPVSRS